MKYFCSMVLLLLFWSFSGLGQTLVLRDSFLLISEPVSVSIDPFGNVYTIEMDGLMHKYDSLGHYKGSAGDKKFSREAVVSAQNPYKISVFDYNTQEFVLFDHKLSLLSRIEFVEIVADAAVSSKADSYWVYSKLSRSIFLFDNPSRMLFQAKVPESDGHEDTLKFLLQEYNQSLYLFIPGQNVFIFDLWGGIKSQFPTQSACMALSRQGIWLSENPSQITLTEYSMPYHTNLFFLLPFTSFSLSGNVLITQDEKKIRFYEIK